MNAHRTLFLTNREAVHNAAAVRAAPPELDVDLRVGAGREAILDLLQEAEFLISERSGLVDAEMLAAGRRLLLVQRLGTQTHDIDLDAAARAGVPVCIMPIRPLINVAEHVIMQMLMLGKRVREAMAVAQEAGDWGRAPVQCDPNTFVINWSGRQGLASIYDSTVGILGFGEIGTELARRLQPFGCTVLYNKRRRLPEFAERRLGIEYAGPDELLARSDYVCSLLPSSAETLGCIDGAFIAKMKPGAFLVHSGASGVLAEDAVSQAIAAGRIGGVATDGYAWEPIRADSAFLPPARQPMTNIVLTPHTAIGNISSDPMRRRADYANCLNLLSARPLIHRVV